VGGAAVIVLVGLLALSAGGSNGEYKVRAIFDDAGNIIPGEDVKIEGVKVGTVSSVEPTPQAQAAVVLKITSSGFQDFRTDAQCTVRPQALIGEKYVDCDPTMPRVEGTEPPPKLARIKSGHEGAGEYLLPVQNTHSPVDVDLLGDISRMPERERLTLILNELGAGLAGRGSDLHEVIIRTNPALQEFDKVLSILASDNKVLAKLADDSDKALAPFAAVRERVAHFLESSNKVAQASAAHRGALAQNLQDFPPFLEQLGPAMERLKSFADQATPVFKDLLVAAPGINEAFTHLPKFSDSSTKFFENLGQTSKVSGPALEATRPLLKQLKAFGTAGKPFAGNLAELFTSLRDTGGIERLMDFIFLGASTTNGYDELGHFLRAEGEGTTCLSYAVTPVSGCTHKLLNSESSSSAKSSAITSNTSVEMARTLSVLDGSTPAQAIAKYPGPTTVSPSESAGSGTSPTSGAQPVGGSTSGTTYYSPSTEGSEAGGMLLNYLLGN
jgi:phospholipid/cholesterol/gamma-HCH transport system substrate-binding protein